jgi:patatin-like phospholipase/acyl hydrolase
MSEERIQILSLDGGGLKGIFTAAFLGFWEKRRGTRIMEVLQLCRNSVVGCQDAPPGLFGLWSIQVAPI